MIRTHCTCVNRCQVRIDVSPRRDPSTSSSDNLTCLQVRDPDDRTVSPSPQCLGERP